MAMHFRKLENSPVLKKLYSFLKDGEYRSTMEITMHCYTPNGAGLVAELRRNGYDIRCTKRFDRTGKKSDKKINEYRMEINKCEQIKLI